MTHNLENFSSPTKSKWNELKSNFEKPPQDELICEFNKLQNLEDRPLIETTQLLFKQERVISEKILICLQEIQKRKIFWNLGYRSLYEMLTTHFNLSESSAYSRISALKIMESVPETQVMLRTGEVNFSTLTLAQSFIQKNERAKERKLTACEKSQVIATIKNKSQTEVKKIFSEVCPEFTQQDQVVTLNEYEKRLHLTIDNKVMQLLNEARDLLAHTVPDGNKNEILKRVLRLANAELRKKKFAIISDGNSEPEHKNRTSSSSAAREHSSKRMFPLDSKAPSNGRTISRHIKNIVFRRAHGACENRIEPNPDTKALNHAKKCGSTYKLEFEHVMPIAIGGDSSLQNIQLLCRSCNLQRAHKAGLLHLSQKKSQKK